MSETATTFTGRAYPPHAATADKYDCSLEGSAVMLESMDTGDCISLSQRKLSEWVFPDGWAAGWKTLSKQCTERRGALYCASPTPQMHLLNASLRLNVSGVKAECFPGRGRWTCRRQYQNGTVCSSPPP